MYQRVSVVRRFYLYRATSSVGFISPVYTLFLLYKELSYAEIGVLGALSATLIVLGEVPTGYVGDRIGRRNSMVVSTVLMTASLVGFVAVETFAGFVILYVPWALGMAFASGSRDAWLYETLRERLDAEKFTRVSGRAGSVQRWTSVATMVAGSLLYVWSPVVPFVAAAALNGAGVLVLLSLPENGRADDDDRERDEQRDHHRDGRDGDHRDGRDDHHRDTGRLTVAGALSVVREHLTRPPLRSFVLYVGLLFAIVGTANVYVQPITVDVLETAFGGLAVGSVAIPEEATLGLVYAGFTAVSAVASYHAGTIESWLGLRRAAVAIPLATALVLVVPTVVPVLAIPAFFAMRASTTVVQPIANQYLNDHAGSAGRATVLSAASMVYALLRAPLKLLAGAAADLWTPILAVAALGALFLVGAVLLFAVETPVRAHREPAGVAE